MTGYGDYLTQPVKVLADFTDRDLTAFIKTLVSEYTVFSQRDHTCGYATPRPAPHRWPLRRADSGGWLSYGCSDHASFYRAGYPSSSVFEPVTNIRCVTHNTHTHTHTHRHTHTHTHSLSGTRLSLIVVRL
jgi:hypothetical protein